MKRIALIGLAMTLGFALQAHSARVWAQGDLNGVWEIVEVSGTNAQGDWTLDNVQPSLFIFQDGYYSIMYVKGNEARPQAAANARRDNIPDAQMRGMFRNFVANSGTYEVNGSSVTTRPMVAMMPNFMTGGSDTFTYSVEGDELVLSGNEFDGQGTYTQKLRRLR